MDKKSYRNIVIIWAFCAIIQLSLSILNAATRNGFGFIISGAFFFHAVYMMKSRYESYKSAA